MFFSSLQKRIARTLVVLISAGFIQTGISLPTAHAAAPIKPTITSLTSGATSLTVNMVTTSIDATQWRWHITTRTGVSCANTYGNGVVQSTGSLSSTISITGLTSGCTYSVKVAGFNGSIGEYAEAEELVGAFTNGLLVYHKNEVGASSAMTRTPFTTGTCATGTVTRLYYDYSSSGPAGCNTDGFTSYYIGYIKAPITGSVTFKAQTDDGFYLNIQGQNVISDSTEHGAAASGSYNSTGSINMVANEIYRFEAWHHEYQSGALVALDWEYSGQSQAVVPTTSFATDPHVFGGYCPLGLVARCAAGSALEIKQSTGTNMDGNYWIMVNGTPTLTYCIMNSVMSGGGWMLAMKGKKSSSTFNYASSYWTNTTQLNETYPERWKTGDTQRDIDAKYGVFSYNKGNQIMALYPEQNGYAGGAIAAGTTGNTSVTYGFSWIETTTAGRTWTSADGDSWNRDSSGSGGPNGSSCVTVATTFTNLFTNSARCAFRKVSSSYSASESPYSAIGNGLFYSQADIRFFGFNYANSNGDARVRFGFGWNENGGTNEYSNDGSGGIGITYSSYAVTAGTVNGCCATQNGLSGGSNTGTNIPFEMYVRNSVTATVSGSNIRVTSKRTSSTTYESAYTASGTNGTNTFRLSPMHEGLSINASTGVLTVSEALPVGIYATSVTVTDTNGVSGSRSVTVQVLADSQETDDAINFTGVASLATSATVSLTGNQTWEAWLKPTSACGNSTQKTAFGSFNFALLCIDGYWWGTFRLSNGTWATVKTSQRIVFDAWTHVAVTRSGTTATFFVNNAQTRVLVSSVWANTWDVASVHSDAANIYIGGYNGGQFFEGVVDEVKVWSEARSLSQITDGMYAAPTLGSANLVAYWDFNDGAGNPAVSRALPSTSSFNFSPLSAQVIPVATTTTSGPYTVVTIPRTLISVRSGWRVPDSVTAASVLLVGGGGGGAGSYTPRPGDPSGAGGAGGVYYAAAVPVVPKSLIPVVVGAGGAGGVPGVERENRHGAKGVSTTFESLSAGGGGGGGYLDATNQDGLAGTAAGAGGGASNYYNAYTSGDPGTSSSATVNGKTFAASATAGAGTIYNAAGYGYNGGGAGGAASHTARGAGITSSITGSSVTYGLGGGGYMPTGWTFSSQTAFGNGGDGEYNESTGGAQGGSGLIVIRYITASKPSFTKPTNTTINLGMVESFTTNAIADSATAGLTRTFRWESTTTGSGGTFSLIKSGTGISNASFSWTPSDTSTTGSNFLYRVVVTDSDSDGLFIVDTSTAVYAVINRTLSLISKSTITKTVNISKTETFTVVNGTPTYRYTLTPDSPYFWVDSSIVGSPRIRIADTATVGTYYETFTVIDSISASITVPLTIVISPPPSFSASASQVDSGTVLYLDAGNKVSYSGSGTSWNDISGRGLVGDLAANLGSKLVSSTINTCTGPTYSSQVNGSFDFSASTKNCLYAANVGTLTSYTAEAWLKRSGAQSGSAALFTTPYSAAGKQINIALLWNNSTDLIAGIYTGSAWIWSAAVTIPDQTWTHAAVTFSGSTLTLYVNNVASTATTGISVAWDSSKLDTGLVFGRKWDADTTWVNGSLASVRIYNRALTTAELTQNYNATKGRFDSTQNKTGVKAVYGSRTSETYTVTAGSESITATFTASAISRIVWDTSTARSIKLQVQESLTVGTYYDTITVTDIYGSSTTLPVRIDVGKAASITISMDTGTVTTYNGSPISAYPKPVIRGLKNSDTGTVTTKFSSTLYSLSSTAPTNADTYTVTAADFTLSVGDLGNYISVIYETSTAVINRARQTPLNVSMYGAVVGSPFTITLLGGSGDGAVTETLTGVSTAPNCAVSNHVLTSAATMTTYCQILVTKAQSQNYLSESSTVQVYFIAYVISQPSPGVSSGPGIGLTGATAIVRDANAAPTITNVQIQNVCNVMGCSTTIYIDGLGFGSAYNTETVVKFWRNKVVTLGGAATPNYVASDSTIVLTELPVGITTGKITVTTANGIAVSPQNWIVP